MNDRTVSVLENYEIEVLRTWKGRGAFLCESDQGLLILKEYTGPEEKVLLQDALLASIKEQGFTKVESILKTKEGTFVVKDHEQTPYILKTYFEGRECNVRDMKECIQAVETLASLHSASMSVDIGELSGRQEFKIDKEYEKHNKELKKVRKFLKDKSQKTNFEIFLVKNYDYFLNIAIQAAEEARFYLPDTSASICHGDFQYHNLIITADGEMAVVNFEKFIRDSPMKDLYHFMRKLMEKNSWQQDIGASLLAAYNSCREMSAEDYAQLYYRLIYPEKFWKIVNFYYNSGKAWIPGRNMEKLEKLLMQEPDKVKFLEYFKNTYGSFSFYKG